MSDPSSEAVTRALAQGLAEEASLDVLYELLVAAKERGASRDAMRQALQVFRREVDPVQEDRILELLDFVVGWCRSEKKLWP